MNRIHIVGNGPSWINFKKIDADDYVIGTNVTRVKEANVTLLSDINICEKISEGRAKIDIPVVVNQHVKNYLLKNPILEIFDIQVRFPDVSPLELSSGHYAAHWAIRKYNPKELHIWGCDSLVKDNTHSYTDELVKHPSKMKAIVMKQCAERWRKAWEKMTDEYKDTTFIFHTFT